MTMPATHVPSHDNLSHPDWCARELCEVTNGRDIAHAETPTVFVTEEGVVLTAARVQDDELEPDGRQIAFPHDVEIATQAGEQVAVLSLTEVTRFAAWVLGLGRTAT